MTDYVPRIDPRRDPEWRSRLTRLQYHVTREAGTEMPNTGIYNMEDRDGSYYCICCGHILFTAGMKYHSGCGWPAFHTDHTHGMRRVEVRCGSCDAHLGHVFDDGPGQFGGERYCINSASMDFVPEGES